jgi:RimJ/RimL family protein N-acetyltransferase
MAEVALRDHRDTDADIVFEWMRDPVAVRMAAFTYWIDRTRWGEGIASAALAAILELDATRPLMGRAASANAGSVAVLRKAGFVEMRRDVGFAPGVGAEVEETIFRLG